MAEAGAESPVAVGESRANGKGPEEDLENATAIEHQGEGGDEKEELHASEVSKGGTGNEAEGEKSPVPEDVKAESSVLEEVVKANKVVTPKKKRGKAPALKSPSKEGEGTVMESRNRKAKELTNTPSDRPSRERKTIERFVASTEKETSREVTIEKGKGTLLKDIPNVAFKVSKRSRADDSLKTLHFVLYRRRVKASHTKNNILQFSGFIWGEDEEKQKTNLKVKLDKMNKEVLFNMGDILDIQGLKTSTKKEEVVAKLIEFLEAPHVTTDVLLEERIEKLKTKSKKRKKRSKGTPGKTSGKTAGKSPHKKRKKSVGSKEEREPTEGESEGDEEVEEENGDKESDLGEEEEAPGSEKEAEDDEDYGVAKKGSKSSTKKQSNKRKRNQNSDKKNPVSSPKKGLRSPSKGSTPKASSGNTVSSPKNSPSSKVFSRKNKKEKVEVNKPVSEGKKQTRKKTKASTDKSNLKEKDGKTKAKGKPGTLDPSDEELRSAIADILKGVDFNTATFTDIVKQLAGRFDMDLTERKGPVKVLIQEELSKLAGEADDGDDDEDQSIGVDGNTEKDESDDLTGQVVEAE